ncbi:hypothetical protein BV898_19419 [Hypsibius exemplaris]|uniref:UPAR/Ly6 domain-containing protein n=1 Tax=Hypsibius exemplaris TaxID=2072580 RepID=A0A9X6NKV1_HYPEX|nr:hypothetical protein BV898_19419 [Hypsibius exemplaris]
MLHTSVLVAVTALIFIGGDEAAQCYSCTAQVRNNAPKTAPCWPESFNPSALKTIDCSGNCHQSIISVSTDTTNTVEEYTRGCAAPGSGCAPQVAAERNDIRSFSGTRRQDCCSRNLCNGLSPASSATLPLPTMTVFAVVWAIICRAAVN